jgi:hypothetical protein
MRRFGGWLAAGAGGWFHCVPAIILASCVRSEALVPSN